MSVLTGFGRLHFPPWQGVTPPGHSRYYCGSGRNFGPSGDAMNPICTKVALLALLSLALGACSDAGPSDVKANGNSNSNTNTNSNTNLPDPYDQLSWSCETVAVDDPNTPSGIQSRLLGAPDGTLFYAFLKRVAPAAECDIAAFSGTGNVASPQFDLFVAVRRPSDTAFSIELVDLDTAGLEDPGGITAQFGIGGAIAPNGEPVFSVAAGGAGLFTCGSADLVTVRRTGANTFTIAAVSTASADFSTTCDEAHCCDPATSACGNGTNVGPWSDVAISAGGAVAVSYTDFHNFADQDGQSFQGHELWESNGGFSGIRPWSGQGNYAALTYADDGSLLTAFTQYNGGGLTVLRRSTGSAWEAPTGSTSGDLFPGYIVGERINFAVAPNGTVGLVFYVRELPDGTDAEDLWFCESLDNGVSWPSNRCTTVDETFLRLGAYPSLAYDSQSRPGISYHYCGADPGCSGDGLRFAWRDNEGAWYTFDVHNVAGNFSGQYTSIVFDPTTDAPRIAFHDLSRGAAMFAEGRFDGGEKGPCKVN